MAISSLFPLPRSFFYRIARIMSIMDCSVTVEGMGLESEERGCPLLSVTMTSVGVNEDTESMTHSAILQEM